MEQIKEINTVLGIVGGVERFIEIIISAYNHERKARIEKEQEIDSEKKAHDETKEKLMTLEVKHAELQTAHAELKQTNPSLDSHNDVVV